MKEQRKELSDGGQIGRGEGTEGKRRAEKKKKEKWKKTGRREEDTYSIPFLQLGSQRKNII